MKDKQNTIGLCFLEAYSDSKEGLQVLLGSSKSRLKKLYKKYNLKLKQIKAKTVYEFPIGLINDGRISWNDSGNIEIQTIFEDENFLVLLKPENMHSHPLGYDEVDNVLSVVLKDYPWIEHINSTQYDRALLHRLDYATSGLLVLAKRESIYQKIRADFHSYFIQKIYYMALKCPHPPSLGSCDFLTCSGGHRGEKMQFCSESSDACLNKNEILEVTNLEEDQHFLLKVRLLTGVRHQARMLALFLGEGILGDSHYGSIKAERMYLHAYEYTWRWEGKDYKVQAPFSWDFSP